MRCRLLSVKYCKILFCPASEGHKTWLDVTEGLHYLSVLTKEGQVMVMHLREM